MKRSWVVVPCLVGLLAGCSDDAGSPSTTVTTTTVDLGPDEGDGTLHLATVFRSTPDGQAQRAAADLAVQDVNDAGGVLGNDVLVGAVGSDQRDLVGSGVDAIIGVDPGNGNLLRSVTDAGVAWVAPAGQTFETDGRLSFRIGADDALVAQATADLVVEDGWATASISSPVPEADDLLVAALEGRGVDVVDTEADALVLVDGVETAEILESAAADGFSLPDHGVYVIGGERATTLGEQLTDRTGILEGTNVLRPGAEVTGELRDRLPDTGDLTGAAEAYDAVVLAALAAEAAGTDDSGHLGAEVVDLTRGGATCTSFDECRDLVDDGQDVVYSGHGGTYALDADGRPTEGVVAVLEYGSDNRIDPNRTEYRVATTS